MKMFPLDVASRKLLAKYGDYDENLNHWKIKTKFGIAHITIYHHVSDAVTNQLFRLPWIYFQFIEPNAKPVGCWGSFNPHSHKWNIMASQSRWNDCCEYLLLELEMRLEWACK